MEDVAKWNLGSGVKMLHCCLGCSSTGGWKGRRVLSCIVEGRGEMCCRKTLPHPSMIRDRASFPNGGKCCTALVRGLLQISAVIHHAGISDMSAPLL